jgi:hypothetical protein
MFGLYSAMFLVIVGSIGVAYAGTALYTRIRDRQWEDSLLKQQEEECPDDYQGADDRYDF